MNILNKIKKIALGMKGNRRILYIAALVLYIAALSVITPRLESLYDRGIINDTARAITYALIVFVVFGLFYGIFRRLDNRGSSLALFMGLVSFVLMLLLSPLFLEAEGLIGAETRSALTPYVIALITLLINIWCFMLLRFESGDRNRKVDDHNLEVEERLEQIADHLGEVVELLKEWDARERD